MSLKDLGLGDPSPFKGEPHALDSFLQDCSLRFSIAPDIYDTEAKQITFALSHLREGDAKRWKEAYLKGRTALVTNTTPFSVGTSWVTFETDLRNSFSEVDKEQDAMHRLQNLRQGKKTVDQHNINFKLLMDKARLTEANNAAILIHFYRESIDPKVRDRIMMMETVPTTITDWWRRAAQFDGMSRRLNQSLGTAFGKSKTNGKNHQGYRPPSQPQKDPNAMDIDALSIEEKKKHLDKNLCFVCHQSGHYSRNCNKRRQKGQGPSTQKNTKAPQGKKRLGTSELRAHIRELVVENIGDDEEQLNDFFDEVEEKGF